MNTTARPFASQSLVSTTTRVAAALAVTCTVALASLGASAASHEAVQSATESFARSTVHVTLPRVVIAARRDGSSGKHS